MALLASCWLIVESFVVPHGFLKWFYLSFYIHPSFLVFCQVFLWLNELKKLLIYFFYPLTVVFRLSLFVFGLIQRVVLFLFSYVRPTGVDLYYDALEPDSAFTLVSCSRKVRIGFYPNLDTHEAKEETCVKDSWLNDYLFSDRYYSSCSSAIIEFYMSESMQSNESVTEVVLLDQHKCTTSFDDDLNSSDEESEDSLISPSNASEPPLLEDTLAFSQDDSVSEVDDVLVDHEGYSLKQEFVMSEDIDAFHHKYTSRVRFFDILYCERLHGINAISNEHLSSPNLFGQSTDYQMQSVVWSRTARKRVLRSLECDLEMICVGQSCLFWEALDHQYHKVESLALSDNYGNILFDHNISGKFQQLEIILQRFVEDERCECKGSSSNNTTSKRLSFQTLLQVPDVTGFVLMGEQNKTMSEDYCMRPTQLLEAIDNCIKAFWSYIKTDEKKSIWKFKGIWTDHSPVEDPQDLELLYDVLKNLHKKGIMLRNLQGKSKCWMRRKVKLVAAEIENRNLMVVMIDVKLVQKILKMSLISKSHLKWCQHKLDNIDFKHDTVFRGRISQLFPSS